MLQPPNKTALKGQDNPGGLSRCFTRQPILADFTMVGSNKMRNCSPNKVGICSEDALDDSYVCSGTFFRRVSNRAVSFAPITVGRVVVVLKPSL